jgi:hypothetical protein
MDLSFTPPPVDEPTAVSRRIRRFWIGEFSLLNVLHGFTQVDAGLSGLPPGARLRRIAPADAHGAGYMLVVEHESYPEVQPGESPPLVQFTFIARRDASARAEAWLRPKVPLPPDGV